MRDSKATRAGRIQEHFDVAVAAPRDLVFARSADGKFYPAEVIASTPESTRVRYLRGSEHTVTADEIRPCAFLPGERVIVNWPWWGQWTCSVVSYDAQQETVRLSDGWGETKVFPIDEVWQGSREPWSGKFRVAATWLSVGLVLGTAVGAAVVSLIR